MQSTEQSLFTGLDQALTIPLPVLHAGQGEYVVPASPLRGPKGKAFRFKYMPVSEDDYLRAAAACIAKLEDTPAWQNWIPETKPLAII